MGGRREGERDGVYGRFAPGRGREGVTNRWVGHVDGIGCAAGVPCVLRMVGRVVVMAFGTDDAGG
jgi:hypothetical protein